MGKWTDCGRINSFGVSQHGTTCLYVHDQEEVYVTVTGQQIQMIEVVIFLSN